MIVYESVPDPWPVFVRGIVRDGSGHVRALGHGMVVGQCVFMRDRTALSYDVLMDDGRALSCVAEQFWDPRNIGRRVIAPAPLRIPAPPAQGARTCP